MPGRRDRKGGAKRGAQGSERRLKTRVETAKGRKLSSTRWLQRQLNDPYVAQAQAQGYRSRAAFKLIQIDEKAGLLKPGGRVVDLGAAPGGWTQVAVAKVGAQGKSGGKVIGIDLQPIDPIPGAELIEMDFLIEGAPEKLKELLDGPADLVLSDMAAPSTGHPQTDHLRIMVLAEVALDFAEEVLAEGGGFVAKVLQGGSEKELLDRLKRRFAKVRHVKPPASRSDSAELYVVASGFRAEKD
ncbi:MAG: RlmE family RNA methyltransferase [Rhodovibrionaceae bacterium]